MKFFRIVKITKYEPKGKAFKRWRKREGLTLAQAAKKLRISPASLSGFEREKIDFVSERIVIRINNILGE
jgi:transcriptional regulator with XRE-family HTH domain